MPYLPSRGHVPDLIKNPLGQSLISSRTYRTWLRAGAVLGVLLPAISILLFDPRDGINCDDDGGHGGRDGDKILDGVRRGQLGREGRERDPGRTPVPALLPGARRIRGADCPPAVADKDTRTGALQRHETAVGTILGVLSGGGGAGGGPPIVLSSLRALGIVNLWYANLLFFLVPVGVVRYMRAHFYCMEAVEVTVRVGVEGSVGLLA